ncbi:gp287 [Sphingomonas phage PAU]|uniref:gp287 n=1 Tax=Sphingomonas phage PAU TaxID=1150991 RepID=UPI000257349E|nr:gp287 [Sphingomonas phage PAU]AFF28285.1 gp287 [Sphingomonas phage PAU]
MKQIISRFLLFTGILWLMTYIGFSIISSSFAIFEWNDIQRGNFSMWIMIFGVASLIGSIISVEDDK